MKKSGLRNVSPMILVFLLFQAIFSMNDATTTVKQGEKESSSQFSLNFIVDLRKADSISQSRAQDAADHGNSLFQSIKNYENISPLIIASNDQLIQVAQANGWNGSGTREDPIIIEHIRIETNSSTNLLTLMNTSLHVVSKDSYFSSLGLKGYTALHLQDVTNVMISRVIVSSVDHGITCDRCTNVSLTSSTIDNAAISGLTTQHSFRLSVVNTSFLDGTAIGWHSFSDEDVIFRDNSFRHLDGDTGILVNQSSNLKITGNILQEGTASGMMLFSVKNVTVKHDGFRLLDQVDVEISSFSSDVILSNNTLHAWTRRARVQF